MLSESKGEKYSISLKSLIEMNEICKKEDCTGCYACLNICPKHCISMKENVIGHIYPEIDQEQCVDCGICFRTCPVNQKNEFRVPQRTYAAWSLDIQDRKTSTSGGVASVFSQTVLAKGGVVYGAVHEGKLSFAHMRIADKSDLIRLKGSKYVHSYIHDTFLLAKKDLEQGKKVLFIGTPCQIAGLNSYLGKSYADLLTVDLVCHGIPPQKMLKDNLAQFDPEKITSIAFRGSNGYEISVCHDKEKVYSAPFYKDFFFIGFLKYLFFRPSCYRCLYAKRERVSDLTIGDFWGLGKLERFDHVCTDGVSLVLCNTVKGIEFVRTCKSYLFLKERTLTEAASGNDQLRNPCRKHPNYDKFLQLYPDLGFYQSVKKCMQKELYRYKFFPCYVFVRKIIMRLI